MSTWNKARRTREKMGCHKWADRGLQSCDSWTIQQTISLDDFLKNFSNNLNHDIETLKKNELLAKYSLLDEYGIHLRVEKGKVFLNGKEYTAEVIL